MFSATLIRTCIFFMSVLQSSLETTLKTRRFNDNVVVTINPSRDINVRVNSTKEIICSSSPKYDDDFMYLIIDKGNNMTTGINFTVNNDIVQNIAFNKTHNNSEIYCKLLTLREKEAQVLGESERVKIRVFDDVVDHKDYESDHVDQLGNTDSLSDNGSMPLPLTIYIITGSVAIILVITIITACTFCRCRRKDEPIYAVPNEVVQYIQLDLPPASSRPQTNYAAPYAKIIGVAKRKHDISHLITDQ